MSEVLSRIDQESPWLLGSLVFVTWILTAALFGMVFGDTLAEAIDVSTVVGALAFATVVIYSKWRPNRRSTAN
ncbi:hypothetical protein [Halococcus hamelinensis]|uniref:Uncharacterized protein n=1 Tax=Halococcus hamelinensis 100A6 TaxID=1132509 RepID=M0LX76_9EURY|nr:hypothetical protein [Halococcus hamelinensis]EMA37778.1 hypothetical protein C447_12420 [Halococcus hamelinensis 100A6]